METLSAPCSQLMWQNTLCSTVLQFQPRIFLPASLTAYSYTSRLQLHDVNVEMRMTKNT